MAMTKKHFEAIAAVLNDCITTNDAEAHSAAAGYDKGYYVGATLAYDDFAHKLCDIFAADNPNFDRARFLKAAGASA